VFNEEVGMTIPGGTGQASSGGRETRLRLPERSVLADDVYNILKEGLLSHRIAPGSRLNLDQLARELHVSNTPVRQALARLESENLVTKEPFRGFAASQLLDSRAIAELYGFRLLIEPPSAARAARHRGEADLLDLDSLCDVQDIQRLVADPAGQDEIAQRDAEFHGHIARQAGNQVIAENLATALNRMRPYTMYHRNTAGELAWEEHRAIAAAIRAADPDAAAAAMRDHLTNGRDRMRKAFG
jgi:DNA-binding GntR family transcriptional regulator